jgi:hypothetical protein
MHATALSRCGHHERPLPAFSNFRCCYLQSSDYRCHNEIVRINSLFHTTISSARHTLGSRNIQAKP